jgi:hypothetical protein
LVNPPECLHELLDVMSVLPDLGTFQISGTSYVIERALCKIHYKRTRPAEFLNTLQAFQRYFWHDMSTLTIKGV